MFEAFFEGFEVNRIIFDVKRSVSRKVGFERVEMGQKST